MFKKKANNNKKIDLQQETEQIHIHQQPRAELPDSGIQQQPEVRENSQEEHVYSGSRTPIFKKKGKSNMFSLDGMEKNDVAASSIINSNPFAFEQQKVATSEIEMCFKEIRKMKEVEPIIEQQNQQEVQSDGSDERRKKTTIRMEDVDLESEPQILEIQVDEEGGFSPELGYGRMEDYDDVNGDYEDELIRKTLTKRNYDNLGKHGGISLNKLKQNQAKDSFVEKLKKLNANAIKKAISRDLYNKKIKLKEINDTLSEISQHGGNKKHEIEVKQKRLKSLKQQFDRLGKVIQYIYYWGDKISEFSIEGISKDIAQKQKRRNEFELDYEEQQF